MVRVRVFVRIGICILTHSMIAVRTLRVQKKTPTRHRQIHMHSRPAEQFLNHTLNKLKQWRTETCMPSNDNTLNHNTQRKTTTCVVENTTTHAIKYDTSALKTV